MARRKKILIVEDNKDCRDLLAKFINRLGYDAIEADSGREAIGKAFEMHPDLIQAPEVISWILASQT